MRFTTVVTARADHLSWDTLEHDAASVAAMSSVLCRWDPRISAGRREWTIRLSVVAPTHDQAVATALGLIEDAGARCGWPLWKISRTSAHPMRAGRALHERSPARRGPMSLVEAERSVMGDTAAPPTLLGVTMDDTV